MAAAQHPELIQGAWLLMLESDYVWMRPLKVGGCQQARQVEEQRQMAQL
jgi:hypothetical protein